MTAAQRAVLAAVRESPHPLTVGALVKRTQRSPSDVGRALMALEHQGSVERDRDGGSLVWRVA